MERRAPRGSVVKTYADTLDDQIAASKRFSNPLTLGLPSMVDDPQGVARKILAADSYFITDEFKRLVFAATDSLPNCHIEPEDIPSLWGWVTFENVSLFSEFIDVDAVRAHTSIATAHLDPHRFDNDRVDGLLWMPIGSRENGELTDIHLAFQLFTEDSLLLPAAIYLLSSRTNDDSRIIRFTKALWLLLSQQNVSETTEETPARPFRKRAERAGVRPLIRVVRLPRRVREPSGEHRDVEWQSRWIVRGHWRQQPWGPERKRIRPVWIAPYVKGPEDKPLAPAAHRLFVADAPSEHAT